MDPEGSTNNKMQKKELTMNEKTSDELTKMISGSALWTYRKPIFTAVVIPKQDSSTSTDSHEFDSDDDVDEKTVPLLADDESDTTKIVHQEIVCSEERESFLFSSMYNYSLIFGIVVGCFIQSSSLGANYILMILFGRDPREMASHQTEIIILSLLWSFMTSFMGIFMLLILRTLVSSAANGLNLNNIVAGRPTVFFNTQLSLVAYLEFPFAFGALAGVCVSWAAIDVALGLRSHAYHSLYTLAFAYIGKVAFEACSGHASDDDEDDWEEENSLLATSEKQAEENVSKVHKEFKVKGAITGLLVGFFIQFSSLGASFLIDALSHGNKNMTTPVIISRQTLLLYSLGWSFVFGTMGVAILLLLRFLVGIVCDHIVSHSQQAKSEADDEEVDEEEEIVDSWAMSLEFFFAAGCLVGVNLAWLITDVVLGLNALMWRSLCTLAVAGLWCFVLAYFFGFNTVLSARSSRRRRWGKKMVTKATQTTKEGYLIV
ncbi:hypothetical protein ACA910_017578 [Epithemia clementina (nom. ined.)]